TAEADEFFPALETIRVPVQTVAAHTPITLAVALTLPPEHHINADAPNGQSLRVDGTPVPLPAPSLDGSSFGVPLDSLAAGTHEARYTLTLYYCRTGNEAACAIRSLQWQISLHASEGGGTVEIPLTATLVAQE
ncbi:MAG TPA: hypothetical protein VIG44_00585, partial [Thermomicrobiales bacterium]